MSAFETFRYGLRKVHLRARTSDEKVIKAIFTDRKYDLLRLPQANEIVSLLEHNRREGRAPLIVDAGANIGASSVYFLDKMPDGLVLAIEPEEKNFELLSRNVEGLAVEAIRAALSNERGRATIVDPGRGHWAYRAQALAEGESVSGSIERVTINDLYAQASKKYFPFLVKIDIEGGEKEVFTSATEWVAKTPIIIIELHDWMLPKQGTARPFLECIAKLDRDFVQWGEDIYSVAHHLDAFRVG